LDPIKKRRQREQAEEESDDDKREGSVDEVAFEGT